MRSRIWRCASLGPLAAVWLACDLTTGLDPQAPVDLALDFCSHETPVWFAYRNHSGDWVRVIPDAEGTFRFTAEFRVTLAYVRQSGSDYHTAFIGALNTELERISGATCLEETATKQLNGSVAGIAGTEKALVTMMFANAYLQSPQTSFSLSNLPDRSLDLIASRVNITGTTLQASDKIIIRKNQNFVSGTNLQVLDLGGAEAVTLPTNTVTVIGLVPGEGTALSNNLFTQQGTSHVLFFSQLTENGDVSVPLVPTSHTADGDYHDLFVIANAADGASFRGVETYVRTPGAKTLAIGGPLAFAPAFTTVSTTPYLRQRMVMSMGSGEYVSAANLLLQQQFQQFSVTKVEVTVTLAYYNRLGEWDLTIPDLSSVDGWQNAWGLQSGTPVSWTITTFAGRGALLLGALPDETEAILFAGRSSAEPLQALRAMRGYRSGFTAPRRRFSARPR